MDTDMARHVDAPKSDPAVIAKLAIDGIEAGDAEIIADEISGRVRAGLGRCGGALPPGGLTGPADSADPACQGGHSGDNRRHAMD
jgi:hypothetical protein